MIRSPGARAIVIAATLGVLALTLPAALGASLSGRVYRNPDCRIEQLELPRGWEITPPAQIGYPRVLVIGTAGGARLVLGVQRVVPGTTAVDVAASARKPLESHGWRDPRITPDGDRAFVDAANARRRLHQLYVVDGDLAFVLTAIVPPERSERVLRDFDATARSLEITPLAAPEGGGVAETSPRCR